MRATAIEHFLSIVQKLSNAEVEQIKPHLESLLEFISMLLDDSNFKISITALQILSIVRASWGRYEAPFSGYFAQSSQSLRRQ